jgi:hypothetical protein
LGRDIAGPNEVREAVLGENQEDKTEELNQEVDADAEVTASEAHWLERLYDKDHRRDEYEEALLGFLAKEGVRPF